MTRTGSCGLRRTALVLLFLAGLPAGGRTIQWFCDFGGSKSFSDGSALDTTIRWELGIFIGGFVPTVSNRAEWAAHWVAAERTDYFPSTEGDPSKGAFNGTVTVTGNDAPFDAGVRAFIWGFTDDLESGEWILASDSGWTWPTPDPIFPPALEWNIGLATEVLAGVVHSSGSPFLLQTEAIPVSVPPTTTWAQWQAAELDGVTDDGPADDPDDDGLSNLEEYAAGTPPLAPSPWVSVAPSIVTAGEERFLAMTVPLRADREVSLEIGVSGVLVNWSYDPAATVLVSETASTLTYRSIVPLDGAPRQFLRARFGLVE
jgi:hypothetical protein